MKFTGTAIGLLLFAMMIVSPTHGDERASDTLSDKEQAINTLLEETGALQIAEQMLANLSRALSPLVTAANPDQAELAAAIMNEANKRALGKHRDQFTGLMVEIYARHFSHDEILGMLEFNRTPLGKKLIEKMPIITQEGFVAGEKFGRAVGAEVVAEIIEALRESKLEIPEELL